MKIGDIVLAGQRRGRAKIIHKYGSRVEIRYLNKNDEVQGGTYTYDHWTLEAAPTKIDWSGLYTLREEVIPVKVIGEFEDWVMVKTSCTKPEVVLTTELAPFDKAATIDKLLTEIAQTMSLHKAKMIAIDLRDIIEMT